MIVTKGIKFKKLMQMVGFHLVWLTAGASLIAFAYDYNHINFLVPWLPMSVIGTAVAFYVGFKNNSAYDRMWEARKIWGAIVNSSRAWAMYVDGFVTNIHTDNKISQEELHSIKPD